MSNWNYKTGEPRTTDPYRAWQNLLYQDIPATAGKVYEPIFLKLSQTADQLQPLSREMLFNPSHSGFLGLDIDEYEKEILLSSDRLKNAPGIGDGLIAFRDPDLGTNPVEGGIYTLSGGDSATVVKIGPRLVYDEGSFTLRVKHTPRIVPRWPATKPMIGVIDDGIGILNSTFFKDSGTKSRIAAAWLQGLGETQTVPFIEAYKRSPIFGVQLSADDIDNLRKAADTSDVHSQLVGVAKTLSRSTTPSQVPFPDFSTTLSSATHGAHVADIAAGISPPVAPNTDPVADMPVAVVDLPSLAVADTTGRLLDFFVLRGLRWLFLQAEHETNSDPTVRSRPLIINLSYGFLAGQKSSPDLFADAVGRLVKARQDSVGDTRMVLPFGNSARSAQAAEAEFGDTIASQILRWRVQPDDATPSYLEVRFPDPTRIAENIHIKLPGETNATAFDVSQLQAAQGTSYHVLKKGGKSVAVVFWVKPFNADLNDGEEFIGICLAPTAKKSLPIGLAPCGTWEIHVTGSNAPSAKVSYEIQRDDAPLPVLDYGRQSYFEEENGDPRERVWHGLPPLNPDLRVKSLGSYSALAVAAAHFNEIYAVAAAERSRLESGGIFADGYRPSQYSPKGNTVAVGVYALPTLAAVADEGPSHPGVVGSGVYSRMAFALNGSSVAAPQVTRALAELADKGDLMPNRPDEIQKLENADRLIAVEASAEIRLGAGIVSQSERRSERTALEVPDDILSV